MAEVEDVAEGALRDIALRVPIACRGNMTALELRIRCEYVHELQSRALNEPPGKAERTRKLAEKIVRSLSDYSYSAAQMELSGLLADARRRGDDQAAVAAWRDLNSMQHQQPRVPVERLVSEATAAITDEAERQLVMPKMQQSRLFRRR